GGEGRNGQQGRQYAADGPWFPAIFGDDPARFGRHPWQGNAPYRETKPPTLARQITDRKVEERRGKINRNCTPNPTIRRKLQKSGATSCLRCAASAIAQKRPCPVRFAAGDRA